MCILSTLLLKTQKCLSSIPIPTHSYRKKPKPALSTTHNNKNLVRESPTLRLFFSERLACGWSLENLLTWPEFVAITENHHRFRWPLPTTFPPWEVRPFRQNEGLGSTDILSFCKRFFFCTRNELVAIHIRCCRC